MDFFRYLTQLIFTWTLCLIGFLFSVLYNAYVSIRRSRIRAENRFYCYKINKAILIHVFFKHNAKKYKEAEKSQPDS